MAENLVYNKRHKFVIFKTESMHMFVLYILQFSQTHVKKTEEA